MGVPLKFVIAKLKLASGKCCSIESIVDLAFNGLITLPFLGANIQPSQVKTEIIQLLKLLVKLKPMYVLEIGTARGGTLFLFAKIADSNATLISVDLFGGHFGGGYPKVKMSYYKSFVTSNQKIHLIREDSHSSLTFNMITKVLEGHALDFLFIDGDHYYNGVKTDFEMYSKLVRKGGIIALHDVCVHPSQFGCNVYKFWREIRSQYEHLEIVNDQKQGWAGIGVIYV